MNEELYYIKLKDMYLREFNIDKFCYKTEFVSDIAFCSDPTFCDTFSCDYAEYIIATLEELGVNNLYRKISDENE